MARAENYGKIKASDLFDENDASLKKTYSEVVDELAVARHDERKKILSLLVDERQRKYITDLSIKGDFEGVKGLIRNQLRSELRTKIEQMGNDE